MCTSNKLKHSLYREGLTVWIKRGHSLQNSGAFLGNFCRFSWKSWLAAKLRKMALYLDLIDTEYLWTCRQSVLASSPFSLVEFLELASISDLNYCLARFWEAVHCNIAPCYAVALMVPSVWLYLKESSMFHTHTSLKHSRLRVHCHQKCKQSNSWNDSFRAPLSGQNLKSPCSFWICIFFHLKFSKLLKVNLVLRKATFFPDAILSVRSFDVVALTFSQRRPGYSGSDQTNKRKWPWSSMHHLPNLLGSESLDECLSSSNNSNTEGADMQEQTGFDRLMLYDLWPNWW